ncbi:MAG: bifunctional diaminohydroxyphosphoribosylaminopyrimidine deaminase/5-amino-6-(5-phosphoribosylamino)uracil reductase RibD, partial [Thiotrichaceae bacterium]
MALALQLAKRGLYTTQPNPRVGCVIVKQGQIVGEGWHERAGEPHAEVYALQQAAEQARDADVYVTLEPCAHFGRTPPCANALVQAGVKRVVVAMLDPNPLVSGKGLAILQQAGIETAIGLLETEARALNPGFISVMQRKRPYIRLKSAMSLDGRTAMVSGESVWITGEAARRDVQFWRAQAGAVLTGINTVLFDDPSLNVRLTAAELGIQGNVRQPVRV